jgi:ribosomal 50S subunit-recycling heat shock protein
MRLDKFLKVSRLIKRRSLAKEASEASRILVNDYVAKPSKELKLGDVLKIEYGRKILVVKVVNLVPSSKKEDASSMYELVQEVTREQPSSIEETKE